MPKAKARLRELARSLVPETNAGDFAQALMDLGALVCTPRTPVCGKCPWRSDCRGRAMGLAESLPLKAGKPARPLKRGAAFVGSDHHGAVLLERRPESGLLGGMLQPPMTPWGKAFPSRDEALGQAPFEAVWKKRSGVVRHGFTHFKLEIEVYYAEAIGARPCGTCKWVSEMDLARAALPTVMRKILAHARISGPTTTAVERR